VRARSLTPADLDDEQRAVYDGIASGPRASGPFRIIEEDGSLTGPFFPMLFAPTVGGALAALGEAIRYDSSLSPRTREIAILAVAALRRSDYEWYAHERVGAAIGMSASELADLKAGREPPYEPADLDVLRASRMLAGGERVDDDLYARLVDELGEAGVFELAVLVGYYTTLAVVMDVFEVSVPRGEPTPF
jgi:4-carboxymuconolactone decarboxylase